MNERMTKRDTDGQAIMDCPKCEADWTCKHGKPMVDCTALYCRNRLLDRLVEYEDTGLTPKLVREVAEFAVWVHENGMDKIREWVKADKEKRLVVQPCKVGDKLYRVFAGEIFEHRVGSMKYFAIQGRWDIETYPFCPYVESSIGKTIFLTREEAERALKEVEQK
nr:MAG TPA: hypothetical protein [Caudoviricetes sp.]